MNAYKRATTGRATTHSCFCCNRGHAVSAEALLVEMRSSTCPHTNTCPVPRTNLFVGTIQFPFPPHCHKTRAREKGVQATPDAGTPFPPHKQTNLCKHFPHSTHADTSSRHSTQILTQIHNNNKQNPHLLVGTIQSLTSSVVACRLTASLALPETRSARS
jgi:hypothetical protein